MSQSTLTPVRERDGVIYTKRWVVDLMLDLVGYTADCDLAALTIIEPAAGDGSFVLAIVERLISSCQNMGRPIESTLDAISAFELDPVAAKRCQEVVIDLLLANDIAREQAWILAQSWIKCADYLLDRDQMTPAHLVVGNPPYIRLEDIPSDRAAKYRSIYRTMVGRADLYVAFFEAALSHLIPEGRCAFICADRWMLNQYGAGLRRLVTSQFSVDTVIELHRADAFRSEVSAYPAITVMRRGAQGSATVARATGAAEVIGSIGIQSVLSQAGEDKATAAQKDGIKAAKVSEWFQDDEPWPCYNPERLALLKYLESNFYPLDSRGTGTRSGIGVASGADQIYLTKDPELVESVRMLPIALAKDIRTGYLEWSGSYLINPWEAHGLISMEKYPRSQEFFRRHEEVLRGRHVGKKNPKSWYRTIDRVEAGLITKTKLYIADIKEQLNPVIDRGETYPHHNLYFIQSAGWDHEVLGGLLLSNVAQFFIECYGVRMRGGYLRFQAQYLRRIRLPRPIDLTSSQAEGLSSAFRARDRQSATEIALKLYGIDHIPEDDY